MKSRILIFILVLVLGASAPAMAAGWEEIQRPPQATERLEQEDVDIAVRDGYVYITTSRTVSVKIFTILGQTVVQSTLNPGNYRFRIKARGIYILKIGSTTRRITI